MTAEQPAGIPEDALRLAEALVFASASPVTARTLSQLLPSELDADAVIAALRERYAGRGVELVEAGGGLQFRTAFDLAPRLRKVIEAPRRLPRVAMETLAIIAYHQPVTRPEIEEIRGASLSQQTLDSLLEANLVTPKGRRESPGRPTLWATTPQFLAQFGLKDIRDLPRRDDLLVETPQPAGREQRRDGKPEAPGGTEEDCDASEADSEGTPGPAGTGEGLDDEPLEPVVGVEQDQDVAGDGPAEVGEGLDDEPVERVAGVEQDQDVAEDGPAEVDEGLDDEPVERVAEVEQDLAGDGADRESGPEATSRLAGSQPSTGESREKSDAPDR